MVFTSKEVFFVQGYVSLPAWCLILPTNGHMELVKVTHINVTYRAGKIDIFSENT